ncbi:MAG: DNA-directed RNA polymerase subunit alpha [Anaerovibrio sp.]|uniref:DNA-directed RNA polymerase subunit alpha n=1 Tax=Anaerovibrio sp. TaxID=1872532 RepID=UPI0025C3CCCA|nr:DNA-directed RNA polymerase subunit alpha [Anaerovibrio sp.]MBE6100212.1 DNA-directed RNA polymerase subunit alpha [Anaerovibrio sp.]
MLDVNTTKIRCSGDVTDKTHGEFICGPLDRGYGTTIGNSLKRILLSSIKGAAVTAVKIAGASSIESKVAATREDAIDIVLNLKGLCINPVEETVVAHIKVKAEGKEEREVTAADIDCSEELNILNPEMHIATVKPGKEFSLDMKIMNGYGYVAASKNNTADSGMFPIDALFSPIDRVDYVVKNTRVGNITNYDSLTLDITTNGSVIPADALKMAANIMIEGLNPFLALCADTVVDEPRPESYGLAQSGSEEAAREAMEELLNSSISELELSQRSTHCMQRNDIYTIGDLVERTSEEIMGFRNLGAKSFKEITDRLAERGLSLKSGGKIY